MTIVLCADRPAARAGSSQHQVAASIQCARTPTNRPVCEESGGATSPRSPPTLVDAGDQGSHPPHASPPGRCARVHRARARRSKVRAAGGASRRRAAPGPAPPRRINALDSARDQAWRARGRLRHQAPQGVYQPGRRAPAAAAYPANAGGRDPYSIAAGHTVASQQVGGRSASRARNPRGHPFSGMRVPENGRGGDASQSRSASTMQAGNGEEEGPRESTQPARLFPAHG